MALLSDDARNAMLAGLTGFLDGGGGTGRLEVWSDDEGPDDLLLVFPLVSPSFVVSETDGIFELDGVPISTEGLAEGTAAYAFFLRDDAGSIADAVISTEDVVDTGPGELVLSSLEVTIGRDFDLQSFTVTIPAGSA